jgi:prefoldin subunit 5
MTPDERFDRINQAIEAISQRFDRIDRSIEALAQRMEALTQHVLDFR